MLATQGLQVLSKQCQELALTLVPTLSQKSLTLMKNDQAQ